MTCKCPNTLTVTPPGQIQAVVDAQPTTRQYALQRIATGGTAYVNNRGRWWRLNTSTMSSDYVRNLPHHTGHDCTKPPPPTAPDNRPRRPPLPDRPPF